MNESQTTRSAVSPAVMDYGRPTGDAGFLKRFSSDPRHAMWAMVLLAAIMTVGFPLYRLTAPREKYILHLSDDSFYYLSVAPNIAAGLGPTADGITRTTGWHPLYGFILAGVHLITGPTLDGFVKEAIALDSLLYLLTAVLLYEAAKTWWGRTAGIAAALLWLCNPFAVLIGQQGLESNLYACLFAALLWRLAHFITRPITTAGYLRSCATLGLCAGLTVLSRTDVVLLMPLLALIVLLRARKTTDISAAIRWEPALLGVAIFGAIVVSAYLAWLAYVYHYTGELNQGSAAVKMEWRKFQMSGKSGRAVLGVTLYMWGQFALGTFLKVPAFKWLLTGLPWLRARSKNLAERGLTQFLWIAPLALGLAYALVLDWTRAWYYMPGLLTLTLLSAGAANVLIFNPPVNLATGTLRLLIRQCAGLIAWAVVIESAFLFVHGVREEFDTDSEKLWALRAADWLEKNVEPHTRVGCWHSGIIGYYTPNLDVINLDGLNNNDILQILRGRKTLNQYWDERNITVIAGRPGEKMGSYKKEWDHKKLVPWNETVGPAGASKSLNIEEQVFQQKIYRVVNTP